ncbi:MAG TPA: HAMP domain-containing sensor histidine kinase [Ochrobactrum sp.]|nr:HAMP domain-containing sensor histidine kinase [Ochrobactrum sp.]
MAQATIAFLAIALLGAALWASGTIHERYDRGQLDVLREAVGRNSQGRLELRETPELQLLRANDPSFWFLLRDTNGERLASGKIPLVYRSFEEAMPDILEAQLGKDGFGAPRPDALIRWEDTAVGRIQFLVGTKGSLSFDRLALAVGEGMKVLFVPGLLLAAVAALLAIPLVVRRTLEGTQQIADSAAKIDPERRGIRLSPDHVPRELAPLVDAFNGTLARLDEGYSRQQQFLAEAAHELRTPIAILSARLEKLPKSALKVDLTRDITRLGTLAGQLLDLQRFNAQAQNFRRVDLVAAAREVVADLAPLAFAAGYDVRFESQTEPIIVHGDRQAIERAISNLFQNAIDHGGSKGTISVILSEDAAIEVADQGRGIPQKLKDRIFEPFRKLDSTSGGTGLGLNLVQQIMAHHGGTIVYTQNRYRGCSLILNFPQREPDSEHR